MKKIKWYRQGGKPCKKTINGLEDTVGYKLPEEYLALLKECDGGAPMNNAFDYFDTNSGEKESSEIGYFLGLNSHHCNFMETLNSPPEFFPKGLVAFADTAGGDYICFDYREDKTASNPKVVYWVHDALITEDEVGLRDVSDIADNFEEFINILYEPKND